MLSTIAGWLFWSICIIVLLTVLMIVLHILISLVKELSNER
nr:MAG TPA: hypothetical protein [Caudoviricetes sp.]